MEDEVDLKFGVYCEEGTDDFTITHCRIHQPIDDPRIKAAIDFYRSNFKIKHIARTICNDCMAALFD